MLYEECEQVGGKVRFLGKIDIKILIHYLSKEKKKILIHWHVSYLSIINVNNVVQIDHKPE
jgi:hypothetical protein